MSLHPTPAPGVDPRDPSVDGFDPRDPVVRHARALDDFSVRVDVLLAELAASEAL